MATFKIQAIKDGAREEWTVEAYDYREAETLYYDTVTSEHDELIAIDKLFATLSEAFDEPDYGGAFDGVSVVSDADPGL